ncbi:WXG100 family type VII secretion target [Nocardioides sp.]|jgi:6 kDa early secretory antigenic target|uniref:WXG100 family type VII secretion target n=1 Tax=Nocardioides sp. TaxID=35761 RepID=UPI000C8E619A|nr:WXG100 family type VII secretion target [Nocardioides sp.]MAS54377.1 WXG100 family type VII secretion target [Pimelobacter sp.]MDE0778984.1 WXG100 family type VII secretion target [Nocardioides sp.]|tara:strand:+ start:228 stop:518 length:291 start_codon:yes stop_codon:yes gene_type:complete
MHDGIRVNHTALIQGAGAMKQGVTDINNRLNQLEGELKLLQSDWTGEQQASYHAAKAKWDKAIQEMAALLNETQLAVGQSQEDYLRADQNGAARFQ